MENFLYLEIKKNSKLTHEQNIIYHIFWRTHRAAP